MDSASSLVIAADVVVYPVMTVRWVAAAPVLRRLFLDTAAAAAVVLDQRRPADSLTLILTLTPILVPTLNLTLTRRVRPAPARRLADPNPIPKI